MKNSDCYTDEEMHWFVEIIDKYFQERLLKAIDTIDLDEPQAYLTNEVNRIAYELEGEVIYNFEISSGNKKQAQKIIKQVADVNIKRVKHIFEDK